MSQVEEPDYRIVRTEGSTEIRDYGPRICAQTEVSGERAAAIGEGFRLIAGYIFGANATKAKIAMTAPVEQKIQPAPGSTPAQVTAPTTWTVRFFMPRSWTIDTLPRPDDPRIRVVTLPPSRVAVIRFSGLATERTLRSKTDELSTFIAKHQLHSTGEPAYAFYDPPWVLPFLRRNEIAFALASSAGGVE
jgi:effector-binding domain-containing protein